jgi:hypothetical protein
MKYELICVCFLAANTHTHARTHIHTRALTPRLALSQQHGVPSLLEVRVLSCLHSPGLRISCYNVVRFFCALEACNLTAGTFAFEFLNFGWKSAASSRHHNTLTWSRRTDLFLSLTPWSTALLEKLIVLSYEILYLLWELYKASQWTLSYTR